MSVCGGRLLVRGSVLPHRLSEVSFTATAMLPICLAPDNAEKDRVVVMEWGRRSETLVNVPSETMPCITVHLGNRSGQGWAWGIVYRAWLIEEDGVTTASEV